MNIKPVSHNPKCIARSVADELAKEHSLEAVTIDQPRQTISVATLGKLQDPQLAERVVGAVEQAEEISARHHCSILSGEGADSLLIC